MKLPHDDYQSLAALAIEAAREAGRFIAGARPSGVEDKPGGHSRASRVVTEVDRRSEAMMLERLRSSCEEFELGLLTEERSDDSSRRHADYFWCIDPLDGTLGFIEGTAGFAVSIALVARDGVPQLGVVYDPVGDRTWHAVRGHGVFRDGCSWDMPTPTNAAITVFADRSFFDHEGFARAREGLAQIARARGLPPPTIVVAGGAVMNALSALQAPPGCYFKLPTPDPGGGSLWDFAATSLLFAEAGASATDMHGRPLDLNRADSTFMNHRGVLFATDRTLAEQIMASCW